MMLPEQQRIQLPLFQLDSHMEQYLKYTMVEQANMLARQLARKELPPFYYTEAGEELGISAKTCREWRIDSWPVTNRPSDENLMQKVAIYLRVFLRLEDNPPEETYAEATRRLHRRIRELDDQKISRNQIAQQMRMSFRTLKDLCEKEGEEPKGRSAHCPWRLLQRLEGAEEEIERQRRLQTEYQGLRFNHSTERREPEIDPGPPTTQNAIEVGDACWKCRAGWQSLREDGNDGWERPIMVCMICGAENAVMLDMNDPDSFDLTKPGEEEFIERYAPCRECHAYWNHMKLERTDRWNNTVYICMRCAAINRVKAKRVRAKTT